MESRWTNWHTGSLIILSVAMFGLGLVLAEQLLVSWLVIMVFLVLLLAAIGHGINGRLAGFLIDSRNRMTLSRLQMFMWTILVLSAFLAVALSNIQKNPADATKALDIEVPEQVWGLLGVSITSSVGVAAIRSRKKNVSASDEAKEATTESLEKSGEDPSKLADPQGVLVTYTNPERASVSDLFKGDEVGPSAAYLEAGKVQMFFFTLIVGFAYATSVGSMFSSGAAVSSLPDLSSGMVALLGISHAGYLGAKAVPATAQRS